MGDGDRLMANGSELCQLHSLDFTSLTICTAEIEKIKLKDYANRFIMILPIASGVVDSNIQASKSNRMWLNNKNYLTFTYQKCDTTTD